MSATKHLVVVMDGFRRDLIDPETTPRIAAFRDRAAWFANSHALYPTVTRPNKVGFATGAHPGEHGIWRNQFYDFDLYPDRQVDLSVMSEVRDADERYPEGLITVPTVGSYMKEAGLRYAAVHTNTAGAAWLLNYRGDRLGFPHYSFAGAYSCSPRDLHDKVEKLLGPQPEAAYPNTPQIEYAVDLFLEVVRPQLAPDVVAIWMSEPDKSLHRDGVGGPVSSQAVQDLDRLFGRITDWWSQHNTKSDEEWQLVLLSDHGHSTQVRRVNLLERIQQGGFDVSNRPTPGTALLEPGSMAAIHWRELPESGRPELIRWLQGQPWIGHIFTRSDHPVQGAFDGTFSLKLINLDHPRVPGVIFTLRGDNEKNAHGYPGRMLVIGSEDAPTTGSGHGGLTDAESNTMLMAAGSRFRERQRFEAPASIADVLPTILSSYGAATVPESSGRTLEEGLRSGGKTPDAVYETHAARGPNGYEQTLNTARVGATRYVLGGTSGTIET